MVKLLSKITIILFGVVLLNLGIVGFWEPLKDDYAGAFIDKDEMLRKSQPGSIVVVGGSSVAFGYDSQLFETAMNRTVINMGIHAGFRLRFMIDSIKPYLKEDDIVLLQLEYTHYINSPDYNADRLRNIVSIDFQRAKPYISTFGQVWSVIKYHPEYSLRQIIISLFDVETGCPGGTYCRSSFNELGDIRETISISDDKSRAKLDGSIAERIIIPTQVLSEDAIDLLNSFSQYAKSVGTEVYIVFPPLPRQLYEREYDTIMSLVSHIEDVVDIQPINEPQGYAHSLFFDTVYHLNVSGRTVHTQLIANALLEQIEK